MTRREVVHSGERIVLDDGVLARDREELDRTPDAPPARYTAAAAHLVMRASFAALDPKGAATLRGEALIPFIDFDTTLAIRRRLAARDFAIAEAMDTAQRFEVGWPVARELIRRTGRANLERGFLAGAGADSAADPLDLDAAIASASAQCREIVSHGGIPILLPLLALPHRHATAEDYVSTYRAILASVDGPVFLHWLGPAFLPALQGYFPGDSFFRILELESEKVRGAKLSLLDAEFERRARSVMLARRQVVLTGDDHHFADLIVGEGRAPTGTVEIGSRDYPLGDFSHALLGIFDAIAAPAEIALRWLARGRRDRAWEILSSLEDLGRTIFETPTQHYKSGLAFLAWLNGYQDSFALPRRADLQRGTEHYLRVARIAGRCGAIEDAELAATRLASLRDSHAC